MEKQNQRGEMSKLNQVWGTWKELETERYEKEFCGKIYIQTVPKQAVKSPMYASQEPFHKSSSQDIVSSLHKLHPLYHFYFINRNQVQG